MALWFWKKKMRIALLPIRSRFSKTRGFEVLSKRHYANISNYYCKLAGVWDIYFLLFNHPNEAKYPRDVESTVIMPNGYQESQCRSCERSRSNHYWDSIRPHSASFSLMLYLQHPPPPARFWSHGFENLQLKLCVLQNKRPFLHWLMSTEKKEEEETISFSPRHISLIKQNENLILNHSSESNST